MRSHFTYDIIIMGIILGGVLILDYLVFLDLLDISWLHSAHWYDLKWACLKLMAVLFRLLLFCYSHPMSGQRTAMAEYFTANTAWKRA